MVRVELAEGADEDLSRFVDHMIQHEVPDVEGRIREIIDALKVLRVHPLMGRPAEDGQRELLIGRGSRAYVARYRYLEAADLVVVLALRAQREQGYRH